MFKQRFCVVVFVAVMAVLVAAPGWATTLSPVSVTGYNIDEMYGAAGGQGGGYAQGVGPGDAWTFYASGAVDTGGVTQNEGLPVGDFASLTDATHIYRLADAGGDTASNNVLNMSNAGPQTGTLTLAASGKYDAIGVLATRTNFGGDSASLVLNYSDDTFSTGLTYSMLDWYNTGSPANGAVNYYRANGASDSGGLDNFTAGSGKNFWLYETVVAADPTKTLVSITFSIPGGSEEHTHVFAVSGNAVPEPGTVVLLATGLIGLLAYAWRKRK